MEGENISRAPISTIDSTFVRFGRSFEIETRDRRIPQSRISSSAGEAARFESVIAAKRQVIDIAPLRPG
jgi:hypothetical protein